MSMTDYLTIYSPGQTVLISGLYKVIDPSGFDTGYTDALVRGDEFPPRRGGSGYRYQLSVVAKHQAP